MAFEWLKPKYQELATRERQRKEKGFEDISADMFTELERRGWTSEAIQEVLSQASEQWGAGVEPETRFGVAQVGEEFRTAERVAGEEAGFKTQKFSEQGAMNRLMASIRARVGEEEREAERYESLAEKIAKQRERMARFRTVLTGAGMLIGGPILGGGIAGATLGGQIGGGGWRT